MLGAYAADGGMFLPASLPQLSQSTLRAWSSLDFPALVLEFMSLFILPEELSREQLAALIERAFGGFTKRDAQTGKQVREEIGFQQLQPDEQGECCNGAQRRVTVAELWHGPTLAFKDLPLQFLGQLLSHFVAKRSAKAGATQQHRINILVGTSGDTGSAAIESVRSSPFVNIFVLYPSHGRITRIQELQMTTVQSEWNNVHVVACDGTSDELDQPILHLFEKDASFKEQHQLCSINSVNVIRILMQCTHFLYAYLRVCPSADQLVDFVLPTGAAGHIAAGILIKQMALPIGRLEAATNDNSLLATFLNEGVFAPRPDGALQTSSPAIDINTPYNIERMLYCMASGSHHEKTRAVRGYLAALNGSQKQFELGAQELARWKEFGLIGQSVKHEQIIQTIRSTWKQQGEGRRANVCGER